MEGTIYPYLELTAVPEVGEALLLPRAAFVTSADGCRVPWANAAGLALFGMTTLADLLALRLSDLNPLKAQAARMARLLPSAAARVEMIRAGAGTHLNVFPATCRRLNLPDGERAVLMIATGGGVTGSLAARAEKLVDALGGGGNVALVRSGGKVLARSVERDDAGGDDKDTDVLVGAAAATPAQVAKGSFNGRPAGAALFHADGRACTLVVAGPRDAAPAGRMAPQAPAPSLAKMEVEGLAPHAPEMPIEMMLPDAVDDDSDMAGAAPADLLVPEFGREIPDDSEPVDSTPLTHFAWAADEALRFTFVSPGLGEVVGGNGDIVGRPFAEIAAVLALDPEGVIAAAHAARTGFTATLFWPTAENDTVAIDLIGSPQPEAGDAPAGYRGFGIIHLDVRGADTRENPAPLAPADEAISTADTDRADTIPADTIAQPATRAPPVEAASEAGVEEGPSTAPTAEDENDMRGSATPPENRPQSAGAQRGISWTPATADASATAGPADSEAPAADEPANAAPSNVVHLPGAAQPPQRTPPERLTGTERDAFRRIAEALGARHAAVTAQEAEESEAEKFARREASKVPATDIDTRVLDRLPIGLVIFRDRRTLFANRTLLELLGYATFDAFLAAGGAEAIFPGGEGIAGHVAEAGGKLAAVRRDGSPVPVQVWLHAVTFGSSTALMLSLNPSRDENMDDEVEIALTDLEDHARELEAILDTATDGVIVFDGRGKIERLNRSAEALFGVNGSEYAGRYFTDLLADESQKPALDYLDGLAANGVASVLNDGREVIGRVPQGGLIPLFMTMGRVGTSDKFCAVLRDITHWKNIEAELTAARRSAEAANAQKSDFLAKISHEIRTPLNAIIGFSEVMMSERFGPIGNERYRDYLHDIHVSGAHLMSLINDLLDLSKIEAGKLDLAFEAVAVNASIQECVALMQPQANRERILIRTSLSANVPNVVADQRSFRQILLNLMSNAIKFTRAGGQVIVSSTLETNGEVTVRIRDTGIGMSEKDIEAALKPFRQVALSRDDREHGTGLGLPLTKAMVEANRAAFTIDSAPNQGTLVKITFPTTRVLAG
jgi:PAS domain S-box-containing protein